MNEWLQQYPVAAVIGATFTGVASVIAAVLYGARQIQSASDSRFDDRISKHEDAENRQFRAIRRLTRAIRDEQKIKAHSFDRLADQIGSLMKSAQDTHYTMRSHTLHDPATGEPIYTLPPNEMFPEALMTADQLAESRDWGHAPLGLKELHEKGITGEGVIVAVLDTGVDTNHPDLSGRIIAVADFTRSASGPADRQGHGSHCAGIVLASADGRGIVGAAPGAKLLSGKVLGDQGSGASGGIAAGIRWAADQGADIISLSLGSPAADNQIRDAISYAAAKGCWIVAAAGNEGPREGTVGFPGGFSSVVCVAAIDQGLRVASFSSRGPAVDVAAPGVQITSLAPGGRYAVMSGTSMATPYVAGCLALVRGELKKAKKPIPTLNDLLDLFKATSRDLDTAGNDTRTGAGLIQPAKLIEKLIGDTKPVDPIPPTDPIRVEIVSAELEKRGVKLVAFLSPEKNCPPADVGIGDLLPGIEAGEWLGIATKILNHLLPLLKEWAKETQTSIDDLILEIIGKLLKESSSNAMCVPKPKDGSTPWWPIVTQVLKLLMPLLKDLAKKTDRKIDDMLLNLIERLLSRGSSYSADDRKVHAKKVLDSMKLTLHSN